MHSCLFSCRSFIAALVLEELVLLLLWTPCYRESQQRKYQDRVEGEPYITAEFSKKDANATFPVGDGKVYSRNGVKVSKRKRRNVNKRKLAYENSYELS